MHQCPISYYSLFIFVAFLWNGCGDGEPSSAFPSTTLFSKIDSGTSGIGFINTVMDTKDFNILSYRNYYNGGGVAIGDINNDSLVDVFLTCNTCPDRLYLNKGDFRFKDITGPAGVGGKDSWTTGVAMADVNADGWLDIYVCYSGDQAGKNKENELFINQHDNTFIEQAGAFGLNDEGFTTHAAFFDYDLDGDLDCFMLNNSFKDIRKFDARTDSRNIRDSLGGQRLYRNDDGFFVDVSEYAGIYGSRIGFGLGISVGDLDRDGFPDMYVSNDFYERDYLYYNNQNGTFREQLPQSMGHTSMFSMGADIGDIDNDGWQDIFSTDMLPMDSRRVKVLSRFDEFNTESMRFASNFHNQFMQNCLQWNQGNGTFSEIACLAGIEASDWSWGALILDLNGDSRQDIFVSNGIYRDITNMDFSDFLADRKNVDNMIRKKGDFDFRDFLPLIPSTPLPNQAYINQGHLTFKESALALGLGESGFSNGAAYGDLDNDGDYDLVINNINSPAGIYQNHSQHHYIKIRLSGENQNTQAIGATVTLKSEQQPLQMLQLYPNRGFQSSVDPSLLFGLTRPETIDSVIIDWPGFKRSVFTGLQVDSTYYIQMSGAQPSKSTLVPAAEIPWFKEVKNAFNGNTRHRENHFIDFHHERLIPNMLSTQGPRLAIGDLNGDLLDDIVTGGASGDITKVFFQDAKGSFIQVRQPQLEEDSIFEDTDLLLYDHDGDQDLDLMVGSGGNEFEEGSEGLSTRLYLNDGKGHFLAFPLLAPPVNTNVSCLRLFRNPKGPMLLFAGGRSISKNYGMNPASYLLMNLQGQWIDITPESLKRPGMVTDAVWNDYNQDGWMDLVITGEWMPITLYKNNGKTLEPDQTIPHSSGWWNTIFTSDLNQDGREDFIFGNWGLNSRIPAAPGRPMTLYVKDFDQNLSTDPLICWYNTDGISYPYPSRSDLISQIPSLKKRILKYSAYATMTFDELFTAQQRQNTERRMVERFEHSVLWNQGEKGFRMDALPVETQVSPVYAIAEADFNADGAKDLILCGNFFKSKPDIGRFDANHGIVLLSDPKTGTFKYVPNRNHGLSLEGEIRDIEGIRIQGRNHLICAFNDGPLMLIDIKSGLAIPPGKVQGQ